MKGRAFFGTILLLIFGLALSSEDVPPKTAENVEPQVDPNIGKAKEGSRTDDEVVEREEEAIKLDGLSVAQQKELREKSERFQFQAEV
ncbi:unnamed protein product, partial [Soboliphyme baturini]|uniref:Uncharacterized protein n=1 Tax=Soboliphyme baturini TaxID=241478 RepID=A0A183IC83_9BILA